MEGSFMGDLKGFDDELHQLVEIEVKRQEEGIHLVSTQNFLDESVRECLSSVLSNVYSEGRPGARYYGGCDIIDEIELLCEKRARAAFNIDESWSINVQPYSRSCANAAVIFALLNTGDKLLTVDLMSGGHPSLGVTEERLSTYSRSALSDAVGLVRRPLYDVYSYNITYEEQGFNMMKIREMALSIRPKLLVVGASGYNGTLEWEAFSAIAKEIGCFLMADMSDVAGLVAANLFPSPFISADVVVTSTNKTLRGPRGAIIFMNKANLGQEGVEAVHRGVFPGFQGGPHNASIAAICTNLHDVNTAEFVEHQNQVLLNCSALYNSLSKKGYIFFGDCKNSHFLVIDMLKSRGIHGGDVELLGKELGLYLCQCNIPGDGLIPSETQRLGGIRVGVSAMTSLNCKEEDMLVISDYLDQLVYMTKELLLVTDIFDEKFQADMRITMRENLKSEDLERMNKLEFRIKNFTPCKA